MKNIDYAKRERVMKRSKQLGHCICDVRRSCPCDIFINQQICPCAGERPEPAPAAQIKLTQHVRNAGCASKIAPADLEAVLKALPPVNDPAVLSGLAAADDAALYQISKETCLVQTVDVFTPCVDDPFLFGQICAANCLSDIYATGGEPRTALSVLGFPSETLPGELMTQMLAGAMSRFAEAGVALVGGHSIKEEEIKLGFAITGTIDPAQAASLSRPQAGDWLVLTKPLGTGVLSFCQQIGRAHPAGMAAAAQSMATLNRGAATAMKAAGASACTDITGFGLFGHLLRLLRPAGLSARVFAKNLPGFEGALAALQNGVIPGAIERNREYAGEFVSVSAGVGEGSALLGFDAQTSGGLVIAIAKDRLGELQQRLAEQGSQGWLIGELLSSAEKPITLVADLPDVAQAATPVQTTQSCCCPSSETAPSASPSVQQAFGAFMRAVQAGGALDARTKELIIFSLVLHSKCAPCFDTHYAKAMDLGISQAELDEAAWCAVALGGAPVKAFYDECLAKTRAAKKPSCC